MTLYVEVEKPKELSDARLMSTVRVYLDELVTNRGYENLELQLVRVHKLDSLLNGGSSDAPHHRKR